MLRVTTSTTVTLEFEDKRESVTLGDIRYLLAEVNSFPDDSYINMRMNNNKISLTVSWDVESPEES